MPTYIEKLPATKSSKSNAIHWTPSAKQRGAGLLAIDTSRGREEYLIVPIAVRAGRAFHFAKVTRGTDKTAETYDVYIGLPHDQCDCKGFSSHGHCKHQAAIHSLVENNWLAITAKANAPVVTFDSVEIVRAMLSGKSFEEATACTQCGESTTMVPRSFAGSGLCSAECVLQADEPSVESMPVETMLAKIAAVETRWFEQTVAKTPFDVVADLHQPGKHVDGKPCSVCGGRNKPGRPKWISGPYCSRKCWDVKIAADANRTFEKDCKLANQDRF